MMAYDQYQGKMDKCELHNIYHYGVCPKCLKEYGGVSYD